MIRMSAIMVKKEARVGNGKNPWSLGRFSPNKWRTVGGGELRHFVPEKSENSRLEYHSHSLSTVWMI